jgi:hypothetical protein
MATKFFGDGGCKAFLAMEDVATQDPWVLGQNDKLLDLSL